MNDLVTDAAIDALCGSVNDGDRYELEAGLNAAAKFIAAEALRQAAKVVIDDAYEEKSGSPSREDWATADGSQLAGEWLERMADDLEAGVR